MNLAIVIIGGLAVWRASHAIVKETGPAMIFTRFRAFLASKQKMQGGFFDLVSCVACTSLWIGLLTALWVATTPFEYFAYSFSFSAVALITEALIASKKDKK